MRRKIFDIHIGHLTIADIRLWPHHHPGNFIDQYEASKPALSPPCCPPNIDVATVFHGFHHGIQMTAAQIKVEYNAYKGQQDWAASSDDCGPRRPGVDTGYGCLASKIFSPTYSPPILPSSAPPHAPTPTKAALHTTPPIAVVAASARQIEPPTKGAPAPPAIPPKVDPKNLVLHGIPGNTETRTPI